jgi:putative CocE/NonD family hydrolase
VRMTKWFETLATLLFVSAFAANPSSVQSQDPSWHDKLSAITYSEVTFRMYQVPMSDGVRLSAAVWTPDVEGKKFPVVMIATPYNKLAEEEGYNVPEMAKFYVHRGYAFIAYDLRGRYDSEGQAYLYGPQDGEDLNAMQTWAAEQPWSIGKIGMFGGSYLGFIQWEGALHENPNLTALIPEVSPDDHYDNVYPSGAFQLSNSLDFLWACCGGRTDTPTDVINWEKWYTQLPLKNMARWAGVQNTKLWSDLLAHPNRDDYWPGVGERIAPGKNGQGKYSQVKVPTFNISGWFDQVSQATINNFLGMVNYGPPDLRATHRLMMGPWTHDGQFETHEGELTFPNQAAPNGDEWRLRWYDHWLKGMDNGFDKEPPVYLYIMGIDRWRNECEWPLKRTQYTKYYIHSEGRANSSLGVGSLDKMPPGQEANDSFSYDPERPVPTLGGNIASEPKYIAGPFDQRAIELRSDVLLYSTPPLKEDVEVTGPVILHLFASTDRTDTDFTGKLVDVYPDGYAEILVEGIIRGRHWKSFREEDLLTPNKIYEFYVDLWSTSNVFKKGHQIRIEVSSSNFPKYDRNPNTGHKFGEDADVLVAHQKIFHDAAHASFVMLPVIPIDSKPCEAGTAAASQSHE